MLKKKVFFHIVGLAFVLYLLLSSVNTHSQTLVMDNGAFEYGLEGNQTDETYSISYLASDIGFSRLRYLISEGTVHYFIGANQNGIYQVQIHKNGSFTLFSLTSENFGSVLEMVVGDIDFDGHMDIVIGLRNQIKFIFMKNYGSEIVSVHNITSSGEFANGAAIIDIIPDNGYREVIFQHGSGFPEVTVYGYNTILAEFGSLQEITGRNSPQPGGLVLADIDNDAQMNIITSGDALGFSVYEIINGSLILDGSYTYDQRPMHPAVGDVLKDNIPDLVYFEDETYKIKIYNPNSGELLQEIDSTERIHDVDLVDVNYDGFLDILTCDDYGIYLALNDGTKVLPFKKLGDTRGWTSVDNLVVLDFDFDEVLDIITTGADTNIFKGTKIGKEMNIYPHKNPKINVDEAYIADNGDFLSSAIVRDLDRDMQTEIYIPYWFTIYGIEGPTYEQVTELGDFNPDGGTAEIRHVETIDINLDGREDLVGGGVQLVLIENVDPADPRTPRKQSMDFEALGNGTIRDLMQFDIDRDGYEELIIRSGKALFYLQPDKLFFEKENIEPIFITTITFGDDPETIVGGNIVGDEYPELISRGYSAIDIVQYNGTNFTSNSLPIANTILIGVFDIDQDGFDEIIAIQYDSAESWLIKIDVHYDDGLVSGVTKISDNFSKTSLFTKNTMADVNHDGKPEIIISTDFEIIIYGLNTTSMYVPEVNKGFSYQIASVLLSDQDTDGYKDLIVFSQSSMEVYWLLPDDYIGIVRNLVLAETSIGVGDEIQSQLYFRYVDTPLHVRIYTQLIGGGQQYWSHQEQEKTEFIGQIGPLNEAGTYFIWLEIRRFDGSIFTIGSEASPLTEIEVVDSNSGISDTTTSSDSDTSSDTTTLSDTSTPSENERIPELDITGDLNFSSNAGVLGIIALYVIARRSRKGIWAKNNG